MCTNSLAILQAAECHVAQHPKCRSHYLIGLKPTLDAGQALITTESEGIMQFISHASMGAMAWEECLFRTMQVGSGTGSGIQSAQEVGGLTSAGADSPDKALPTSRIRAGMSSLCIEFDSKVDFMGKPCPHASNAVARSPWHLWVARLEHRHRLLTLCTCD